MKLKSSKILVFLIFLLANFGYSQKNTTTGKVIDQSKLPIPGVSISVKNTKIQTQTDLDGNYSINASVGQLIVYSFIGMQTQEAKAGDVVINIQLFNSSTKLDQVVITALGIEKSEKKLGFAVSKIESDEIRKSGEQNIIQALAGKAAGIQVIGTGGTPGASSKIIIRGTNTITRKTDPLVVVDGIPINNETLQLTAGDNPFNENLDGVNNSNRALDINPEDIESVSILKGAAAAALYGERAGNGVILYTTKKGKKDQGLGIDFSTSLSIDRVNKLPAKQRIYVQGKDNKALNTQVSQSWGPTAESLGLQTYNNEENFFTDGITNTTNLALYGGTNKNSYRLSFGNLQQTGMIPQTELKRNTVRLNTDFVISSKIKASASLQYTNINNTLVQNGSNVAGVMLSLLRSPIQYDITNYKDSEGNNKNYYSFYDNPLFTVNENPATSLVDRIIGNFNLNYHVLNWFNINLKGGFDNYSDTKQQIFALSSNGADLGGVGSISINTINTKELYSDIIGSGNIPLKSNWLQLNYIAGLNVRSYQNKNIFSRGKNLQIRNLYSLSNATELYASNYDIKNISRAVFGQLEFDIKNQLFITTTSRKEWSSTYGTNTKGVIFSSISSSWLVTNSFNLPKWINYTKLTYAYGEAGIAPETYKTRSTYNQPFLTDGYTSLSFPYIGVNGLSLSGTLGNINLRPEIIIENEIGISSKLFNNRVYFDLNFYKKTSKDVLVDVPLASSSGFTSEYRNAAEIKNHGVEAEIGFKIFKNTKAFQWNIDLNWTQNKNEITEISEGLNEFEIEAGFESPRFFAIKGKPTGSIYGTKWSRDEKGQLLINKNGLPLIEKTSQYIGNTSPVWISGIRNTLSYNNITLSSLIEIRRGGDISNKTLGRLNRMGVSEQSADRERMYVIAGVKENGNPNDIPITAQKYFGTYLGDSGQYADESFIETVNWIRLRDVTLSYDFKKTMFKFISSAQISLSGRNLWLLTNYKGVDPETSLTGAGSRINGLDYFNNPGSKSIIINLLFNL